MKLQADNGEERYDHERRIGFSSEGAAFQSLPK